MARKAKAAETPSEGAVEARVLVDFHHAGEKVPVGTLFVGPAALVAQYAKDGVLDPHPDAVAYVKAQG